MQDADFGIPSSARGVVPIAVAGLGRELGWCVLRSTLTFGLCLALSACGSSPRALDPADESGEGEASSSASSDGASGVTVTSAGEEASTSDEGDAADEVGEDEESGATGFVSLDMGDDGILDCDINAEFNECPEGQKCSPYLSEIGGGWWDSLGCFDIAEETVPLYGECTWNDGFFQGGDNCEEYAYCRPTGVEGVGECVGVCRGPWGGSSEVEVCEDEATTPYVGCQSCFCECMRNCDPLLQDCGEGQACLLNFNDGFMCVFDASGDEGQIGDACPYANTCDPGNVCVARETLPEAICADLSSGCCTTFCDLNDDPCEALVPGTICLPALESPAVGFEHIGICSLPA